MELALEYLLIQSGRRKRENMKKKIQDAKASNTFANGSLTPQTLNNLMRRSLNAGRR